MSDLPCTQLTPPTVYSATPAIHYATVGGNSSRYVDDTLVGVGRGVDMDCSMYNLENKP